ncbi:MAG: glycosyltransferase family 2 protein [Elusimicrobia bacterium]|nr:glycosyltransferase family 2 protein [Elusimicrobiota bacterium]
MNPEISVIIPVFNESGNIAPLAAKLEEVFSKTAASLEVIWVDDGSTDGSYGEIRANLRPNAAAIRFSRNFGQTAALAAGIAAARGVWTVPLDADLQNDPRDIPKMIERAGEGFDVVSGWRKKRNDSFFTRVLPSMAANAVISRVTGIRLHDYGCTLKVYRTSLLKDLDLYGEMHRFLPALLGYGGASITEMEVSHHPRVVGRSKYGLTRTFKVLLDLFTVKFMGDFITKPIYLFGGLSLALGLVSACLAGCTLYNKLAAHIFVKDQPLFLVAIFLALVGVQMAFLGLVAELIIRSYHSSAKKPFYRVKETLGGTGSQAPQNPIDRAPV